MRAPLAGSFRPLLAGLISTHDTLLAAIDTLRAMNRRNARKVPDDAPTGFLRPRWKPYVLTEAGADRAFY